VIILRESSSLTCDCDAEDEEMFHGDHRVVCGMLLPEFYDGKGVFFLMWLIVFGLFSLPCP